MKTIVLIDGSSLIFRAFYAIRELRTKDGIYTNGVYGFLSMYYKIMEDYNPDYACVAFDRSGPTLREKDYDQYKANRDKVPSELSSQFGILKDILDSMGIKHVDLDGYEADDIIGTLAKIFNENGYEAVIVTGDRDFLQLVNDNTKVVLTKRGITNTVTYDLEKIKEEFELDPKQLIDVKGLMGDASDNIPGVPGIGEKTALKLVRQFGNIDNIYENIDDVSGKALKSNLIENKDIAYLSRNLGEIILNTPVDSSLEDYSIKEADYESLKEKFDRLEFRTFASKLPNSDKNDDVKSEYLMIDEFNISEIKENIGKTKEYTFKIFFDDDSYIRSKPIAIGIKPKGIKKVYISRLGSTESENIQLDLEREEESGNYMDLSQIIDGELSKIFKDKKYIKTSFDIKSDLYFFLKNGIEIENYRDSMISDYLIDPSQTGFSVQKQALQYLSKNMVDIDELRGKGKKRKFMSELEDDQLFEYISDYLTITEKIYPIVDKIVEEREMHELYYDIELPLIKVLADMENTGFKADTKVLEKIGDELIGKIEKLEHDIHEIAGYEFNVGSPKQLGEVLFDKLGLPVIKKTKTGYSTDAEVLDKLLGKHEIIEMIHEYRSITKLKSTYIDGLMPLISKDGRIHSTFRQNITATGRISSTDPNLQNIPIKTEEGRRIRKAFVASEGCKLVDADYSQIELRVLAHLSNDETMIKAFKNDEDIHTKTASECFHVDMKDVTPLMRSRAKAVNFGIVYGISDYGLSRDLGIPRAESKKYIENYLATYPGIKKYMDDIVKKGKEDGYVETILNRRRYVPELESKNFNIRGFGERIALNTPIQGSAADIIKIAMVNVYNALRDRNLESKLILQVHDELIIDALEDEIDEIKSMLLEIMEAAQDLKVELKADISTGDSWYDSK
ncbi:MAG: DNA polymerase I [Tissierellia bacterium]|nr:DNA polymerase I [Tissierellia bacterium]